MRYRLTPKVVPLSILPSAVGVKLPSSTAVPDDRADLDILLPGGQVWPFRRPELTFLISGLKPEEHSRKLLFYFERAFAKWDDEPPHPFCAIKPPFSQQKATTGTLETPISRYNAVVLMTAAHCQDERWGGKHAYWGFSARGNCEKAISFIDFGSANCSVVTFLRAVLHPMYISEVKCNETLNENHFHTTPPLLHCRKQKSGIAISLASLVLRGRLENEEKPDFTLCGGVQHLRVFFSSCRWFVDLFCSVSFQTTFRVFECVWYN